MEPEIKLLDRDKHEIDQVIAEWVAGTEKSLEGLYEVLLLDQEIGTCEVVHEGDGGGEGSLPPSAQATQLVEDTIRTLAVTPLNLTRIESWCRREASPAGYEALFTSFSCLLTTEQRQEYRREASKLFIPEVVLEWLE